MRIWEKPSRPPRRRSQITPTRGPFLSIDNDILTENAAQLRRLESLADCLSDTDLQRDVDGGSGLMTRRTDTLR